MAVVQRGVEGAVEVLRDLGDAAASEQAAADTRREGEDLRDGVAKLSRGLDHSSGLAILRDVHGEFLDEWQFEEQL